MTLHRHRIDQPVKPGSADRVFGRDTGTELPAGRDNLLSVGSELSLWNPLFADWLSWMRNTAPHIALRAEVDTPHRLIERVQNGTLDAVVLYSPQRRPNLVIELLAEEKLIMVTSEADGSYTPDSYIHVDWGEEFAANQQSAFPSLGSPTVSVSLGPLALRYLLTVGGSGYFRMSAIHENLKRGELHLVPNAPEFSHSIYLIRGEHETAEMPIIREGFKSCLKNG